MSHQNTSGSPEQSHQRGLFLSAPSSIGVGQQHPVVVSDLSCINSNWGCIAIKEHIDASLSDILTSRNHHAVQLTHGTNATVKIWNLYSYKDDWGLKVESSTIDTQMIVEMRDSVLYGSGNGISWGVGHSSSASAPMPNELTLDNVYAQGLTANTFDAIVDIKNTEFTLETVPVDLNYIGNSINIEDTIIPSYLYLTSVLPSFAGSIDLTRVVFDGPGKALEDSNAAIETSVDYGGTVRAITLTDVWADCTNGTCPDSLIQLQGGTVDLDYATAKNWRDDTTVVQAVANTHWNHTTQVFYEGVYLMDTVFDGDQWCGDQAPVGSLDFQCQ